MHSILRFISQNVKSINFQFFFSFWRKNIEIICFSVIMLVAPYKNIMKTIIKKKQKQKKTTKTDKKK